jgi:hypothetical protein
MGNPGPSLAAHYDLRSQEKSIIAASKSGPLQSLTDRELAIADQPLTVYPYRLQRRVRAWVRFGPESIRVDAVIVRSTPKAAGIEFRAGDQRFRCWVWGNAVELVGGTHGAQ